MTAITEFLSRLRSLDVTILAEGDRLRFSAPKGVMTEGLRREILVRKPEILEFLQKVPVSIQPKPPTLARVSRKSDLSPSYAQQRLWFIDQFEAGSPLYNIAACAQLSGDLNLMALERSLTEITRRHETLRTTFISRNGKPFLRIKPEPYLPMTIVDLSGIPSVYRRDEALRLARKEGGRAFDLLQGPLMRVSLFRLDANEHILLVTMHHIISDGWSVSVLMRELASLYKAFVHGQPSPLPELPIQYADFAHGQREWLQGGVLESQLDYWKTRLGSLQPVLDLPGDRPRPPVQSFKGGLQGFTLPADLSESIRSITRQEGATQFMTLLAAFQTLLYRYTGHENFAVGSPIANRRLVEVESLIGLFANTLVFGAELTGEITFRELLQRVRARALEAYGHQDLPFDLLVDALQPQRTLSHTPLFQTMFVLQNTPAETLDLPGVTLTEMPIDLESSIFDLTLSMSERRGILQGSFEYSRDVFDSATIRRMIRHFQGLLGSAVEDPDRPVSLLEWLAPSERGQMLMEWNDTARELPPHRCIHNLFEARVECAPDAIAIQYEHGELTYRELNRRANRLAHFLQKQGVGPDTMIGLCMGRSLELVIGLMGILKAGAAYVPLDPSYPPERLSLMVEDSGVGIILTQERFKIKCSEFSVQGSEDRGQRTEVRGQPTSRRGGQSVGTKERPCAHEEFHTRGQRTEVSIARNPKPGTRNVICLDTDWEKIAAESDENPSVDVTPSNLAYVIFTSGSTGKPKGVMIQHGSAVNLGESLYRTIYRPAGEIPLRVSLNAPLSFDASVQQILMLLYGHTVVIIPGDIRLDGEALISFLERYRVDVLDCVPSQLKLLLSDALLQGRGWAPSIVLPGGEAIDDAVWQVLRNEADTEFYNMYGPTECTVDSTACRVSEAGSKPTIGRPLSNVQFYVLDSRLQPLPVGVPGELHIGGAGLGRGYFNRPDLTAEKFIPDSFGEDAGARLYKTGDLMRYLPDGNLEFLGRIDHQVKLRGFRIELGDIESALKGHSDVKDAVAILREDTPGDKRLTAYVVVERDSFNVSGLRGYLKSRLPGYMIPSAFIAMESLPLSPSGKVDRKALPLPDQLRPELEADYIAPRTHDEDTLARIWSEILGVERIGADDNFFELGGDSILSIQVVARAKQKGLHFTPKELFQNPTISALAALARREAAVFSEQGPVEGPVPLTPIQRWFFEQNFPEPNHWNQSLLLEPGAHFHPALAHSVVACLIKHHDALRLRFRQGENGWHQENAGVEQEAPFSWIDLSQVPEKIQEEMIKEGSASAQASLNLTRGPIFRLAYFGLGSGKGGRLLIVFHHLAVDGISWRILLADFWSVYDRISKGEPPQLPPKTTSFKKWAERLEEHARTDPVNAESIYWLSAARSGALPLPLDFPNGENTEHSERSVSTVLTIEETKALLQEVPASYGTEVNDVLIAALAQTMGPFMGSRRLFIEMEGHGREDLFSDMDVSRTVGWFTTLYPLMLDLNRAEWPGQVLRTVKEHLRQIPNRGIGCGLLRYLGRDEARASMHSLPKAEISLNYLGQFAQPSSGTEPFFAAAESCGPERSPKAHRTHILNISGIIVDGQLRITWFYSENLHRPESIRHLAYALVHALREIISHCRSLDEEGYTPSDFPDVELSQDEIEALRAEIHEGLT